MTIDDLNQKFAIIAVGNKMCVMEIGANGTIVELWDFDEFRKKLIKEFIRMRTDGKVKTVPLADVWLKHPQGRQYEKLVYAMPGSIEIAGPNDYNGWQGFRFEPIQGDWSRNRAHIKNIICNGNEMHYRWVINWLAALVQRPGQHAWTAIVLRGGQGIGKGHFADKMIGGLFGQQQYIHIIGAGQLTADFNEHMSGKAYVFADESTWGGDPKAASKLKGMITENTMPIHRKFLKVTEEPSALHTVIASNSAWPVPIDTDDRRFLVLDVNESRRQDQVYFGQLLRELKDDGHAAMLYDLMQVEIDDAALRQPIMTQAKAQVAVQSMKAIEHWMLEVLENGSFDGSAWPTHMTSRAIHDSYLQFLSLHYKIDRERRSTGTEVGMFMGKLGVVVQQITVEGRRERVMKFPSLDECRAAWCKMLNWPDHNWDQGDDVPKPKEEF